MQDLTLGDLVAEGFEMHEDSSDARGLEFLAQSSSADDDCPGADRRTPRRSSALRRT